MNHEQKADKCKAMDILQNNGSILLKGVNVMKDNERLNAAEAAQDRGDTPTKGCVRS